MKVLAIIGIVLLCLFLIVALVLLLPVRVIIRYSGDGELKLLVKFFGIVFGENDRTEKSADTKDKKDRNLLGLGSFKQNVRENGLLATVQSLAGLLKLFVNRAVWLLRHCLVERFHLKIVCAGDDAAETAMEYGAVCAVVYPLVGLLQNAARFEEKGLDIAVLCDYDSKDTVLQFDTTVRVRVVYLLCALAFIIFENVKKQRSSL